MDQNNNNNIPITIFDYESNELDRVGVLLFFWVKEVIKGKVQKSTTISYRPHLDCLRATWVEASKGEGAGSSATEA